MSHSSGHPSDHPNVHQVRENMASYLEAVERGEEVVICRRNQPVARLVPYAGARRREPRPLGGAPDAGQALPEGFFDDMPADWLVPRPGAPL